MACTCPTGSADLHAIGNLAADDHQVLVDDRRRALGEVLRVGHARQPSVSDTSPLFPNDGTGLPVLASSMNSRSRLFRKMRRLLPSRQKRRAAQLVAAAGQHLPELVRLTVEAPQLLAGLGVERRDAVVRRRHVEHAVDHERRGLEVARHGAVLLDRRFPVLPFPRLLQAADVRQVDVGQRGVFRAALVAAVVPPFDLAGLVLRPRREHGHRGGDDRSDYEQRACAHHAGKRRPYRGFRDFR